MRMFISGTGSMVAVVIALCAACTGCGADLASAPVTREPRADLTELAPPRPQLLHLPGIGGERSIDRMLVGGLIEGGIDADVEIYDWTHDDPGLNSLYANRRNLAEAEKVAQMILQRRRDDPRAPIYLTAHSGGAGIAVWALEKLPADVQIQSLMLLAPALSPRYDLSEALRHVKGKCYVLSSMYDPVLGIGTRMFGTIDGVRTDAAGRVGFEKPEQADDQQYEKLVQIPYDPVWIRLHNIGDHIGAMMRPFAREVLAPLLDSAAVQRVTAAATRAATLTE